MDDRYQIILDLIGVSLHDGRSRVLRAIFNAQPTIGTLVYFEDMYMHLQKEEGGKGMAKPLVYRYLKSLEKDGLIKVDRSAGRHGYSVGLEVLIQSFENLFRQNATKLEKKLEELRKLGERLSSIDAEDIAEELFETIVGKQKKLTNRPATNIQAIFRLMDRYILDKSKKGDVIRICIDWVNITPEQERARYLKTIEVLKRDVEIRVLTRIREPPIESIKQMRESEYLATEPQLPVSLRYLEKQYRGYQIVAKNRDGMVMIISDVPLSGIWMSRETDEIMVDDAIDAFDAEFEEAVDLVELLKGRE